MSRKLTAENKELYSKIYNDYLHYANKNPYLNKMQVIRLFCRKYRYKEQNISDILRLCFGVNGNNKEKFALLCEEVNKQYQALLIAEPKRTRDYYSQIIAYNLNMEKQKIKNIFVNLCIYKDTHKENKKREKETGDYIESKKGDYCNSEWTRLFKSGEFMRFSPAWVGKNQAA